MAFQFDPGIFSIEGLSGEILPGTTLGWFVSGTSTPQATYSNQALSIPNANPIVIGADGRLPVIWLINQPYKLVMTLPNGTVLTRDPIVSEAGTLFDDLLDTGDDKGADLVGFIQAGTGAVARKVQDKLRDSVSPEDFGAVGDGVTDDSAAFLTALAAHSVVECNGNKHYVLKDVVLSNNETIDGNGARFSAAAGAAFLFKLTNYAATVTNFYVVSGNCSDAVFVFDNGRFCRVSDGTILNSTSAFALRATVAATGCIQPIIHSVHVENYTGNGIALFPNVAQLEATDVFLGAYATGTIGVTHVSTGSVIAYGGHTYTNVRCESVDTGWIFTDATLVEINGGWADTCAQIGVRVTGATDHLNINNFFIGTSGLKGLTTENTARVYVNGLETFVATDTVEVFDTSTLIMNVPAWRGPKVLAVASGATFVPAGATILTGTSVGAISASTNAFLGVNAVQSTEVDTSWPMPFPGYILGIYGRSTDTPVSTHVYTARLSEDNTALVATTNPGGFTSQAWGAVVAAKGQTINGRVATSTTTPSRHSIQIVLAPN